MCHKLKDVCYYSEERVCLKELNRSNYITTDNLLPNKKGKAQAENLPPTQAFVVRYEQGDILVSNIRPYLKKIWFADAGGGNSADVLTFKVKEGFHPKFVYYSLFRDDFFNHMMKGSKGTKMPRGDKNQILEFTIPKFKFNDQVRIAKVLSDLDAKIEINIKINDELENITRTIYDYWFVQFDFPDANGKPYKASGGKMIFNKLLKRDIPVGWNLNKLGDILNQVSESIEPQEYPELNYLPIDKLPTKKLYYQEYENRSEANSSLIRFQEDDILLGAMRVYFHRVCNAIEDGISRSTMMVLRPINPIHKNFALFTLFRDEAIEYATKNSTGTSIPYAKWTNNIENYKFSMPSSTDLVERFNKIINPILERLKVNSKENQKLQELRDWLLPMLMNGQVTIKEAQEHINKAAEPQESYQK